MKVLKILGNIFFPILLIAAITVYTYRGLTEANFFWIPGVILIVAILFNWYLFRKHIAKGKNNE